MRTTGDRIRHALLFEIVGLFVVTPLAAWAFEKPLYDIGAVAVVSATLATLWNYLYNLGFDRMMLRLRGDVRKTPAIRVVHAVAFEAGLLVVLMPFIAWYLGIGLIEAFLIDLSFAGFYLVYAFAFNWGYDVVFPVPVPEGAGPRA
jgi:uncharacterized membrane protein